MSENLQLVGKFQAPILNQNIKFLVFRKNSITDDEQLTWTNIS